MSKESNARPAPHRVAKPPFANVFWFPIAALYSALILPLSVGGQLGWFPAPAGLQYAWGHGHEMIFGFALAVIAGYIAGPQRKEYAFSMIGLWLVARVSFWLAPTNVFSAMFNIAFVGALVWKLAPIFLRTAKKWRNKSVGFVLVGLAIASVGFHSVLQNSGTFALSQNQLSQCFLLEAVLLLSTLMFYMGGRIIAPALAGHFQRRGIHLKDRVQPRFEGGILILLLLSLLLNLTPFTWAPAVLALLLGTSALLCVVRVLRWRPWWCYDRADLLAMLLGYSWIIVGWVCIALSLLQSNFPITHALHAITVGALGTLTFTVMARSRSHRVLRDPNAKPWLFILPLLITISTLLRLNAHKFDYTLSLMLAVACWSAAFAGLFVWLLWLNKAEQKKKRQRELE